jgi:threonine dehydrogenase-like Zn-dependent dehydrogenase
MSSGVVVTEGFSSSPSMSTSPRRHNHHHHFHHLAPCRLRNDNAIIGHAASDQHALEEKNDGISSGSGATQHVDVIICGGGPTGLLTAIMMAQTFPHVRFVLERPLTCLA